MKSNKLLTLGLALTIMSPLTSYAKMGAESGGGGDAVIVDNKMVIRDLLPGQMESVTSNLKFINSVKGFRKLIHAIAEVNPDLASSIIFDLSEASIYTTKEKLKLLPYDQTTMNGRAADIQLAVRIDSDIVFGPEFMEYEEAQYVLLHEALHGLLTNNSGPMHHIRVRSIVKYIHDNVNNLDKEELKLVLSKNNFNTKVDRQEMNTYFWAEKKSESLRCAFAFRMMNQELVNFENLKCLGVPSYYPSSLKKDVNLNKFIDERFPEIKSLRGEGSSISLDIFEKRYESFYTSYFTLEKDSVFNSARKKIQQQNCLRNKEYIVSAARDEAIVNANLEVVEKVKVILEDDSISTGEKIGLVDFLGFYGNGNYDSFSLETLEQVKVWEDLNLYKKKLIVVHEDKLNNLQTACEKQYPNL
jgi:hypothetical protein